jgi:hypothetical protein
VCSSGSCPTKRTPFPLRRNSETHRPLPFLRNSKTMLFFHDGTTLPLRQNSVTMLVYLNDVPEKFGGHTTFPKLDLRVSPAAHTAVVFNDCLPNGEEDPRTLHGGAPPTPDFEGSKVAINIWIRAAPWMRPDRRGV